ncbi:MAG: helix-hairpin-helix domain-containing protein [Clostridiales bacterium]|nr:helix-hairpin-helix domain-containing protein [Clostridiales bacterium]
MKRKVVCVALAALIAACICFAYYRYHTGRTETWAAGFDGALPSSVSVDEFFVHTEAGPEPPAAITETSEVTVYITGAVINPGVYTLEDGSRVGDLLREAGGGSETADLDAVNLAAILKDSQHIKIPRIGEEPEEPPDYEEPGETGMVNINTAPLAELKTLPGIGDVIAGNIIEYREQKGLFKTKEEIKNVQRIGDKTYENLEEYITVE